MAAQSLLEASGGFILAVIILAVIFTAWFQFKIFRSLERSRLQIAAEIAEIRGMIGQHDLRITNIDHEIASIKGNMVGWSVLKRIESYVSGMSRGDAVAGIAAALSAEVRGRRETDHEY